MVYSSALDTALGGGRYADEAAYAHGRLHVTPQVANSVRYGMPRAPSGEEGGRGMRSGLLSPHPI